MYFCNNESCENVTKEFHEACIEGYLKKVTILQRRNEEIDIKQLDKNDTLERVVGKGCSEIVKLLLKIGVNVNKKGRFYGATPFLLACAKGHFLIAKLLLENGADMNTIVKHSITAPTSLHFAVKHKNTAIAKLLLENGCKTDVRNQEGFTAMELAAARGYIDVVKQFAFQNQ